MRRLLRFLFGCRHPEGLLREDRLQQGLRVRGFGCVLCGHWQPQVQRTTAERRRLVRQIAERSTVRRMPKDNVQPIVRRRGA